MTTVVIAAIVATILGLGIRACALPIVMHLVGLWVNIYTRLVPVTVGERRRMEIQADLHDQIQEGGTRGYSPSEIAIHIAWRWLLGIPNDIMWGSSEGLATRETIYAKRAWANPKAPTMTFTRGGEEPVVAKGIVRGILWSKRYVFYAFRDGEGPYQVATLTPVPGSLSHLLTKLIRRRVRQSGDGENGPR